MTFGLLERFVWLAVYCAALHSGRPPAARAQWALQDYRTAFPHD